MDIAQIFKYFEEHIGWRNIVIVLMMFVSGYVGYWFCNARRDKEDARLINECTVEVKAYSDSMQAVKARANMLEVEYKVLLWRREKTIDSLNMIINSMRNEDR